MKVHELIALGGSGVLPSSNGPPSQEGLEEIRNIYHEIYGPGLCQFFETQWYSLRGGQGNNSISILIDSQPVTSMFSDILGIFTQADSSDASQATRITNLETHLVWALATLAYSVVPKPTNGTDAPATTPDDSVLQVCNRLHIFETLLSGEVLTTNPVPPPPLETVTDSLELTFWYNLATYLHNPTHDSRHASLAAMRSTLEGKENRDILYSLAIMREYSGRFEPGYEIIMPTVLDEAEPRHKLHVATRFMKSEANAAGGTTNVARRFAGLGVKAFVSPGVNIVRQH